MPAFKLFVVAVLLGGLAVTMNLTAEKPAPETPMMVNTPAATL